MDMICVGIKKGELITLERDPIITSEIVEDIAKLLPVLTIDAPPVTQHTLDTIVDNECVTLFIARDNGNNIIGMLCLLMFPLPSGIHARIEDVVVSKKYQGKGVGRALNERAIWFAQQKKVKCIDLTSRSDREAAEFYIKLGFKRRDTGVFRYTYEDNNE